MIRPLLLAAATFVAHPAAAADPVTVVALGDSITKGVRPGVKDDETFAALLVARLKKQGVTAKVMNAGVGGEKTDGALARLDKGVLAHKPGVVLVMYGTNDSYVYKGKTESDLSVETYRDNLVKLVELLRTGGAEPVLMTPPRWAPGEKNGISENPNDRLEKYVAVCRAVAKDKAVMLVDHYQHWADAEKKGTTIRDWTTDGYHPNPRGHREMADLIEPVLLKAAKAAPAK